MNDREMVSRAQAALGRHGIDEGVAGGGDHAALGRGRGGVGRLHPGERASGGPDAPAGEIVPDQPRPMDEGTILSEKWRLMLSPSGDREHSSTVLLRARHVQGVAVHDVEKF